MRNRQLATEELVLPMSCTHFPPYDSGWEKERSLLSSSSRGRSSPMFRSVRKDTVLLWSRACHTLRRAISFISWVVVCLYLWWRMMFGYIISLLCCAIFSLFQNSDSIGDHLGQPCKHSINDNPVHLENGLGDSLHSSECTEPRSDSCRETEQLLMLERSENGSSDSLGNDHREYEPCRPLGSILSPLVMPIPSPVSPKALSSFDEVLSESPSPVTTSCPQSTFGTRVRKLIGEPGSQCALCGHTLEEGDSVVMAPTCVEGIKHHTKCFYESDVVFKKDGAMVFPCDCGSFHPALGVREGSFLRRTEESVRSETSPVSPRCPKRECSGTQGEALSETGAWGDTRCLSEDFASAAALEGCRTFANVEPSALAIVDGMARLRPVSVLASGLSPSLAALELDPDSLSVRFERQDILSRDETIHLLQRAKGLLEGEENVLELEGETVVVGDLHGQFFDLLEVMRTCGQPPARQYLFLGDYVDRGRFSCEVALYLLSLKLAFPRKVFLLRGNHETRNQTSICGFERECRAKYGTEVYEEFLRCFTALPVAAILSQAGMDKSLFCVHGGLSPRLKSIDDIRAMDRHMEPEDGTLLADLLWSDPSDDVSLEDSDPSYAPPSPSCLTSSCASVRDVVEYPRAPTCASPRAWAPRSPPKRGRCRSVMGVREKSPEPGSSEALGMVGAACKNGSTSGDPRMVRHSNPAWRGFKRNVARGCSWSYDLGAVNAFLQANSLRGILRAHSVQGEGYHRHFQSGTCNASSNGEGVATVFSAPKYSSYQNRGAVLIVRESGTVDAVGYDAVPEPAVVNRAKDAVRRVCPYMPISLKGLGALEMCKTLLELRKMCGSVMSPDTFNDGEALTLRVLWEALSGGAGVITEHSLFDFDDVYGEGGSCLEAGAALRTLSPRGSATAGDFLVLAWVLKIAYGIKERQCSGRPNGYHTRSPFNVAKVLGL